VTGTGSSGELDVHPAELGDEGHLLALEQRRGSPLPPESGSTRMYTIAIIGSTRRQLSSASRRRGRGRAASVRAAATSALSTRSTSPLEVDTRPGDKA